MGGAEGCGPGYSFQCPPELPIETLPLHLTMAQTHGVLNNEEFCCPICLDLLKDPVAIPCGHSYCMGCIRGYWASDGDLETVSCPQCRQSFTPRPILKRNTLPAEMVEELKKMHLQAASPATAATTTSTATAAALCLGTSEDVPCDLCTRSKRRAVKSCLMCLASYCKLHLQAHYECPALKKHKLVEAAAQLQDKICPHHDKLLEIYCRSDQKCVCILCVMEEHKGHDTVSAAAETTRKQVETTEL